VPTLPDVELYARRVSLCSDLESCSISPFGESLESLRLLSSHRDSADTEKQVS